MTGSLLCPVNCIMIGYWHDTVVCLSVCLSVTLCIVAKLNDTSYSKSRGSRHTILQLSGSAHRLEPLNLPT